MPNEKRKLTPPEVARLWGVSPDKIIGFILAGELRAINAAQTQGGRPRYLIDVDDLAAFERSRSTAPKPEAKPARRTRKPCKQYV